MEFKLPQELQQYLYVSTTPKSKKDDELKPGKPKKAPAQRHPLGHVYGLIPDAYVDTDSFRMAVEFINERDKLHRKHIFRNADNKCIAILYHYSNCWTAAWHANEDDDYLYGVSICFKNTDSNFANCPIDLHQFFNPISKYSYGEYNQPFGYSLKKIKVKRTEFIVATRHVSLEDIKNIKYKKTSDFFDNNNNNNSKWYSLFGSKTTRDHHYPSSSHAQLFLGYNYVISESNWKSCKPSYINLVNVFEEKLRIKVGAVNNEPVFKRLTTPNVLPYAFDIGSYKSLVDDKCDMLNDKDFILNHSSIIKIVKQSKDTSVCKYNGRVLDLVSTPFFAKKINSICSEVNELWDNSYNINPSAFMSKGTGIHKIFSSIYWVLSVWPECPVDYIQNNIDALLQVTDLLSNPNEYLLTEQCPHMWLRTNMPAKTFFNMLSKEAAKEYEQEYQNPVRAFRRQFNDTIQMIGECLLKNAEVLPPSRWRIDEFHDHVMAESWKLNNENTILPQFLLPDPIQVQSDSNKWSFFQPKDTHQLASWGQAVRNCVGSANYADGIKANKHFIVLAMLDNKPVFTVQLGKQDASCAALTVQQIKGISNQSLTHSQELEYSKVFQEALAIRASQLQPLLTAASH